jgi:hypothetical protein
MLGRTLVHCGSSVEASDDGRLKTKSAFFDSRDNSWGFANDQNIAIDNDCIGLLGSGRGKGGIKFVGRGRLN